MTKKWFKLGIITIFILSLCLRFWGLDRFNTLVFDEVYYVKFSNNYLTHTPFFDGHPPLAKYIIAFGIWLGNRLPIFPINTVNGLSGSLLSPWHYRWLNAFTGAFIPLIIAGIAYQLSRRPSFCLIAGLFAGCDGIFLVESRYALINQYIVIFGLLAQLLLLLALGNVGIKRQFFLCLSGISFGAAISCKWNGLSFLLGIYIIWLFAQGWQWVVNKFQKYGDDETTLGSMIDNQSLESRITQFNQKNCYFPLYKLSELNIYQIIFYLGIIPLVIYCIIWIPHLKLDIRYNFIEIHQQILQFHKGLGGNTSDIHPYCAAWYTWPLMIRPIAYYYQTASSFQDPLPVLGPQLPVESSKVIYDVHAMGNPFLWWFGLTALLFLLIILIGKFAIPIIISKNPAIAAPITIDIWISLFLLCNYGANLLPWVGVHRCVFIYHYMTSVVFAFLAIAWLVDKFLASYNLVLRASGITITFIILIAFAFWMPIYLGLPLSPSAYQMRMWFNSWI